MTTIPPTRPAAEPRVKRHYSVIGHSPDEVELRCGVWNPVSVTVSDRHGSGRPWRLVSQLDGTLSTADLATRERVSRAEVEELVDTLDQLGAIEREPTSALEHYLGDTVTTLSAGRPEQVLP